MKDEEKANKIVEKLKNFSEKELFSKIKNADKYPELKEDLQEIFLVGAWYGALKAFQLNKLNPVKE